jgi:four helix bundle protein
VIARYPKFEKHTLQIQIKNCIIDMERKVVRVRKSTTKKSHLYDIDVSLEELRMLIRLSHDLRYISTKQYGKTSLRLVEIGKILGGLIASVQTDKNKGEALQP